MIFASLRQHRYVMMNLRNKERMQATTFYHFKKGQIIQDPDFGGGKWKVIKVIEK